MGLHLEQIYRDGRTDVKNLLVYYIHYQRNSYICGVKYEFNK